VGALWLINGRECVISSAIYALAGGDRTTRDILLPDWFARRIMVGTTMVLVVSFLVAVVRAVVRGRFLQRSPAGRGSTGID
jgi:hypothetical protein